MSTTLESLEQRVKKLEDKSGSQKTFGKQYSSAGTTSSDFLIKTRAGVKIQMGRKFIDLIKDGKINVDDSTCIYEADAVGSKDGIYVIGSGDDVQVILKVGDQTITLLGEIGTTYVSFMGEQETTADMKYQALTNIGFLYSSIDDFTTDSLQNGIIYIESTQKLYIVKNGEISEYEFEFPNPFTEQFVIAKETDGDGALVIQGEGTENSLMFDSLMIYVEDDDTYMKSDGSIYIYINDNKKITITKSKVTFETDVISEYFGSPNATSDAGFRLYMSNGESTLEVDNLIVRNGIDLDNSMIPYPLWWFFSNNVISEAEIYDEDDEDDEDEDDEDDMEAGDVKYTLTLKYKGNYSEGDILYVYFVKDNEFITIPLKVESAKENYDTEEADYDYYVAISESGDIILILDDVLYITSGTEFIDPSDDDDDDDVEYTWSDDETYITYNDVDYYIDDDVDEEAGSNSIIFTINGTEYTVETDIVGAGSTTVTVSIMSDGFTDDYTYDDFNSDYYTSNFISELDGLLIFKVASASGEDAILSIGQDIDIKYSTSNADVIDDTISQVRIGNLTTLDKDRIDNNITEGVSDIEGIGVYANELAALEAQYVSGYNLPITDNSSRFASTEWVINYVNENVSQAGYYWSNEKDDNDQPIDPVYVGTAIGDFEVSEDQIYLWYTNDQETYSLVDEYIFPDEDYIYFLSMSAASVNYINSSISYNCTVPAGFIAIVTEDGTTNYYTFMTESGEVDNDITNASEDCTSLYFSTGVTSADEASSYKTRLLAILQEAQAGVIPDIEGFYVLWRVKVSDIESGTITFTSSNGDTLNLIQTSSTSSIFEEPVNAMYHATGGIINTNDLGRYWVTLDDDGYINGCDDWQYSSGSYGESDAELDANARYGISVDQWGSLEWVKKWIMQWMQYIYSLNDSYYSETFDRYLINSALSSAENGKSSMVISCGFGGDIHVASYGSSDPDYSTDFIFSPEVYFTAHLVYGYVTVDLNMRRVQIGGKLTDIGQANSSAVLSSNSTPTISDGFFEVMGFADMNIVIRSHSRTSGDTVTYTYIYYPEYNVNTSDSDYEPTINTVTQTYD